jgi:putative Mg2+ transporter-C (MgtC) family protein
MPPIEDQMEIIGRLALAAVLGGLIGLERELRGYPAGIRTLALVTMGSLLFTDVSQLLGGDDRVAAGIVTGIGFLGAGVIFREGYTVRGITTAATIWAAAAIGMAIGRELYLVAGVGAVLVFLVLEARPFTRRVDEAVRRRTRELSEELEGLITSSDMNDRQQNGDEDD